MPPRAVCELCGVEVNWLQVKEAAALVGVTPHTVRRWVDQGRVHIWEHPNDRCLICDRSLAPGGKGHIGRRHPRLRVIDGAKEDARSDS